MVNSQAAWLNKSGAPLEVRDGVKDIDAKVGDSDVLIENKAVAMNPGQ
jgi:hypothetical protein